MVESTSLTKLSALFCAFLLGFTGGCSSDSENSDDAAIEVESSEPRVMAADEFLHWAESETRRYSQGIKKFDKDQPGPVFEVNGVVSSIAKDRCKIRASGIATVSFHFADESTTEQLKRWMWIRARGNGKALGAVLENVALLESIPAIDIAAEEVAAWDGDRVKELDGKSIIIQGHVTKVKDRGITVKLNENVTFMCSKNAMLGLMFGGPGSSPRTESPTKQFERGQQVRIVGEFRGVSQHAKDKELDPEQKVYNLIDFELIAPD